MQSPVENAVEWRKEKFTQTYDMRTILDAYHGQHQACVSLKVGDNKLGDAKLATRTWHHLYFLEMADLRAGQDVVRQNSAP